MWLQRQAGFSVTISGDGSRVAMGAPSSDRATADDAGSVLIFSYDGSNWVLSGNVIESPVTAYLDGPVALTDNSNRVVVGGTMFTPIVCGKELEYSGGVSVYDIVGNVWVQAGDAILGLDYYDRFGHDVDMNASSSGLRREITMQDRVVSMKLLRNPLRLHSSQLLLLPVCRQVQLLVVRRPQIFQQQQRQ